MSMSLTHYHQHFTIIEFKTTKVSVSVKEMLFLDEGKAEKEASSPHIKRNTRSLKQTVVDLCQ